LIFFEQERTKSHMMRLSFSEQANDEKKKKGKKKIKKINENNETKLN